MCLPPGADKNGKSSEKFIFLLSFGESVTSLSYSKGWDKPSPLYSLLSPYLVRITGPSLVITSGAHIGRRPPSRVYVPNHSESVSISQVPVLIIGSTVGSFPPRKRRPRPLFGHNAAPLAPLFRVAFTDL